MMRPLIVPSVVVTIGLILAEPAACAPGPAQPAPLVLERTIKLRSVTGRIDHLAVDPRRHRVFVAELGNGSVEAIDLDKGVSLGRVTGLKEPQGLAYLPALDQLAVASGGDGTVRFYRAGDLEPVGVTPVGEDADDARLDDRGRIVVGYGSGGLAVIDPVSRAVMARLGLPSHPEGFQIVGQQALVNLPGAHQIVTGDLGTGRVTSAWRALHLFNFPMALSADGKSVAVVYRLPARLQLINAATGEVKLDRPTCGDADDVFFDAPRRRIYVVCGSGAINVVTLGATVHSASVKSEPGARTGLFVPELDRLLVAARANGGDAALLIYRPQDRPE
jgi:hypothetical protein